MHIIVTGGGTGGHVFPALEIAKELRRENVDVLFVGNRNGLEEKLAHNESLPFVGLSTKKIVGQSLVKKISALFALVFAVCASVAILLKKRPHAVIGVGGYVSAPMVIAAFLLFIRRYICEQNVVPGFANRKLGLIANKVFASFAESARYFPKNKVVVTGNPVRAEFFSERKPPSTTGALRVFITGGSLGARFLNHHVPAALVRVRETIPLVITHQTGEPMRAEVEALYNNANMDARVIPFITDMARTFADHDLLISRAGATVCAEIMASGMPAILVPYTHANAHQKYNALALAKKGAALMVEENDDFISRLSDAILSFSRDRQTLLSMSRVVKSLATSKAASTIAHNVLNDA